MKITTVYSEMMRKAEHPEGSVQARIAADLDRFNGTLLLPSVVGQVLGHLQHNWNLEGFRVELDGVPPGVVEYLPSASVYFDPPFEVLELRLREHDWNEGPCPKCNKPGIQESVAWTTGERALECPNCNHRFVQRY